MPTRGLAAAAVASPKVRPPINLHHFWRILLAAVGHILWRIVAIVKDVLTVLYEIAAEGGVNQTRTVSSWKHVSGMS